MTTLALQSVSKEFAPNRSAVESLDLDIADGELLALVGPSGCGKTTTLRLIAGLERPTTGDVSIGHRSAAGIAPRDRNVAMVFQESALYPHLTVRENIAFPLRCHGLQKKSIGARVDETAALVGVEDLLDRRPGSLSGGERQRAALARALARQPGILLLDEPLSDLDPSLRRAMRAEIKMLHERIGTTTVLVTHDQEDAMILGQRIAVMADGRLLQCGAPLDIYRHPVNRFVAGFFGSPPMNFIDGVLRCRDGVASFLDNGDLSMDLPDRLWGFDAPPTEIDRPVVLGIRPRDLRPSEASSIDVAVRGQVRSLEPTGPFLNVRLVTRAGAPIIWQTDFHMHTRSPAKGDSIALRLDADDVRLFEPGPFGSALGAPA